MTNEAFGRFNDRLFQSTHLHEVWLFALSISPRMRSFNPHTYMRCDLVIHSVNLHILCFNPHTYMRCDFLLVFESVIVFFVSIHTPTWGVTSTHEYEYKQLFVSIHTPTWGVTSAIKQTDSYLKFQSTHLHEVWRRTATLRNRLRTVSIHTPTWGVTVELVLFLATLKVSIHTPTWGVTK